MRIIDVPIFFPGDRYKPTWKYGVIEPGQCDQVQEWMFAFALLVPGSSKCG